MGKLDFVYTTSGLEASFRVISKVPVKAILDWDFGDDKGEVFNVKGMNPILMRNQVFILLP